ncbi:MAG: TlpA disulfide reductase family protein [Steroidobacteraceae bacterium]
MNAPRVLAGLLLGLSLCVAVSGVAEAAKPAPVEAPEFAKADLQGATWRLTALRGKVVLLNFWATWCAPCLLEMPEFSAWQKEFGPRGFQVLGVSMDDTRSPVERLARQRPPGYPLIMGDTALAKLYGGVFGLPTTFLIDRQGRIVASHRGEANLPELKARIDSLLSAGR